MKMSLFLVSVLLVLGFPFIMSVIVNSFKTCGDHFFKEEPPKITGILDNNRYKSICHRSGNHYGYATLYDTQNKIPVFSAYKYTGRSSDFKVGRNFKDTPGLENTREVYHKNEQDMTRGHIFPMSYAADEETAKSTCDMSNIVPQIARFNGGSWERMEGKVKQLMDSQCRDEKDNNKILAYGLTGAVPSQNNWLKNRINIPTHMWTAFCCYNSKRSQWQSLAHWAENIDESNKEGKTISEQSLAHLQEFLKDKYNTEYILFNGECLDMFNAEASQPNNQQNDQEYVFLQYLRSLAAEYWAAFRNFWGLDE